MTRVEREGRGEDGMERMTTKGYFTIHVETMREKERGRNRTVYDMRGREQVGAKVISLYVE